MMDSILSTGFVLVWFGARLLGLIGWLVLSYVFLTGGRFCLLQLSWTWWFCLIIGVPGAVFLLWYFLGCLHMIFNADAGFHSSDKFYGLASFWIGPAVLPLTLHLFWLRFAGCRRSDQSDAADRVNPNSVG